MHFQILNDSVLCKVQNFFKLMEYFVIDTEDAAFLSANHCYPKDVIKLSTTIKKEKIGKGIKMNVTF